MNTRELYQSSSLMMLLGSALLLVEPAASAMDYARGGFENTQFIVGGSLFSLLAFLASFLSWKGRLIQGGVMAGSIFVLFFVYGSSLRNYEGFGVGGIFLLLIGSLAALALSRGIGYRSKSDS